MNNTDYLFYMILRVTYLAACGRFVLFDRLRHFFSSNGIFSTTSAVFYNSPFKVKTAVQVRNLPQKRALEKKVVYLFIQ